MSDARDNSANKGYHYASYGFGRNHKPIDFFELCTNEKIKISIEYEDQSQAVPEASKQSVSVNAIHEKREGGEGGHEDLDRSGSYYGSYTPFSERMPNDCNYTQAIPKIQINQSFSQTPMQHQCNPYISFQNHFHCYPLPIFHYVPYYPKNMQPQSHSQQKTTQPTTVNAQTPTKENSYLTEGKDNEALKQIERLFSFSYLNKDVYFRSSMNENGWLSFNTLMTIVSIKKLGLEIGRIVTCLNKSDTKTVEIKSIPSEESYFIRKANWEEFRKGLLNIDEIKRQKLSKLQNHYLSSSLKEANTDSMTQFSGAVLQKAHVPYVIPFLTVIK